MTGKQLGLLAAGGSAVLLLSAFIFQALGYAPCAMCIWQRYPHAVAIGAGVLLAIGFAPLVLLAVGAASAATTAIIGVYHTGVERDWWQGPTSCTGSGLDLSSLTGSDLLPSASSGPSNLVMCDEVAWEFLTLSMASWNAIWSAVLAWIWVLVIIRVITHRQSLEAAKPS
ncbi:disulfide bond formation protein B [Jannaschia sp. S6380]|uniref:disulfide bond formation protein B n=1 Tax=Jannaschia sp. S6380 TaxID=2926408 RepID=UPI001FF194CA|nr:disulfide bond formation protein B [Jannaschia sp. S6380]